MTTTAEPSTSPETGTTPVQANIRNVGGAREDARTTVKAPSASSDVPDPARDLTTSRKSIPEPPPMSIGSKVVISFAALALLALSCWGVTKAPCFAVAYRRLF